MSETTTVDMERLHAESEVAADLRGAVSLYTERAAEADTAADNYENSAKLSRALAAEYRAKLVVLREHCATLGIDLPEAPPEG